jgi:coenzyme F420-reducing hydrogenase alpha subunit
MGLQLKKVGNDLVTLVGGREIHPINVRVGGFYRVFAKEEFGVLEERLKWARDAALKTVDWVAGFHFPEYEADYEFVALHHPEEYPLNEGRLVSSRGLDIAVRDYEKHFQEEHVLHSHALQSALVTGGPYHVGPLARYNLNFDRLSPLAREAGHKAGLGRECLNPFQSIVVRAVEMVYAVDEALRLIETYEMPDAAAMAVEPRAGEGCACTEAPRGILYHRYRLDAAGLIQEAKIVPPTSQNQKSMEEDLRQFVAANLDLPEDQLTWQCEQMIRNYDPCISCATHFLRLKFEKSPEG